MLPSDHIDARLSEIVELPRGGAHPSKILLFGSYARGDQASDSDLDLIVVLPAVTDRFAEMVRLRRVLKPIRMPIDVLVYSEDEAEQRSQEPGTVLYEAAREGKTLYVAQQSR